MDAIEALMGRASPLKLTTPGPDAAQLDTILKAGARAADHGRMQPFRFVIIDEEGRNRFGDLLADALKRREPQVPDSLLEGERAKPLRAPVIIAVAAAVRPNPKVPDLEQIVAVGAAAQNMLNAAHALGLGGFWRTGAPAYDQSVKSGLGFAPSDIIVGFLYFGSPVALPPVRSADVDALTRRF